MRAFNRIKAFLVVAAAVISFIGLSATANAQTISYRALRYGTNRTSIASGYFVKHANVTVSSHHYVVTMQIKTAKNLSSFPVAVNWVNGQKPKNVRKVKDRAGNSRYYYSFTTTNLHKRINAKLAIDVPKVYKAHHLISFKFNTANLPSLGHKATAHVSAAVSAHPKAVASSRNQSSASKRSSVKSPSAKKATVPAKKQTSKKQNKAAASQSAPSKKETAKSSKKASSPSSAAQSSPSKSSQRPRPVKKAANHTPWVIGGVVAVVVATGGGSWLFFKQ